MSSIVETNLTIQGNRLNVITKKVTGWAAIIVLAGLVLYLIFKRKDWI